VAERKKRLWDDGHKTAIAEACRQLQVCNNAILTFSLKTLYFFYFLIFSQDKSFEFFNIFTI